MVSVTGRAAELKSVQVYKSPTCGCCEKYIEYLKQNGIDVPVIDVPEMAEGKTKYGVPGALQSCHTSLVNDYVVEGRIPVGASAVRVEHWTLVEAQGLRFFELQE